MGNADPNGKLNGGILEYIHEEYERVTQDRQRGWLTLSEVLEINAHQDFPFDFRHFAILFVCDQQHDGLFSLDDLQYLASWIQLNMVSVQMYEFKSQLQARTVSMIISLLNKKEGEQIIIQWFLKALMADKTHRLINGSTYIKIQAIKLIYEIFNVKVMSDLDIQTFFYLIKKSAEEMGAPVEEIKEHPQDQDFQEYIELAICRQFITHFLKGATKILKQIGYSNTVV